MEYGLDFIIANWDTIVATAKTVGTGFATIVAGASIIAKVTPTKVDDNFIGKVIRFMDKLALNNKPTELK